MVSTEYITLEEIASIMDEVVDIFLIPRFKELGMNATGDWINNAGGDSEPGKGLIMGLDYTEQLVKGQEPTTVPIADLKRWAKAKFRLSDNAAAGVAVRVQRKIKEEGTSWYEKGGSDLLEVLEEQQTINYVMMKIGEKVTPRIQDQLLRQLRG